MPGQKPGSEETVGGLPKGKQVVKPDNIEGLPEGHPTVHMTGRLEWTFGNTLQHGVYELMQNRWRAKVCPECGRYFIAQKTAQKHCSPKCYQEKKHKGSLDYYYRQGKDRREERRELEERKRKKR